MDQQTRLKEFRKNFHKKIDFFLLPNSDEFFSEYLPESEKRIQAVTGFTGSNAIVIFGPEKSYFFTDGRYVLQAKNQLDLNEFEIFNMAEKPLFEWLRSNWIFGKKLAIDSKLINIDFVSRCKEIAKNNSAELVILDHNPIDEVWFNRPKPKDSAIFLCSEKQTGQGSQIKISQVLQGLEAEFLIITKPENLCWLLNIRASDVEFTPLLLAYAILFKNGTVDLFIDEKRLSKSQSVDLQSLKKVNILPVSYFSLRLAELRKSLTKIQLDSRSTNYWLYDILQKNNFEITFKSDACEILKACKNSTEISGAIKAHQIDGLAVTKFLFWLQKSVNENVEIDEISAQEKLLEFRKNSPDFLYPSFASISSFAANAAIIHYQATSETNKKICGKNVVSDSLYLIDSGGQYFGENFLGTTDITRTVAIGKPSLEMIENFTRILKGHIALARLKFPRQTTGSQLDVLARFHLWNAQKDYDHGTGHGVGSFLSVHEGPCAISKKNHQALLEGMILSNEPGFYEEGKYGIRIENLMLVEKFDEKFLQFKTLTVAPIDPQLVDFSMLTYPEKKWLHDYHQMIFEVLNCDLESEERIWLKNISNFYRN